MITFNNLTLRRGPRVLLQDVNLSIFAGQRVGIVGRNGTGKSSLFALMLGELDADAGSVDIPANLDVAASRQLTPNLDCSALDYVMDGDPELRRTQTELDDPATMDDYGRLAELHETMHAIDGYTAQARAAKLLYGLGFAEADNARPVRSFSGGWRVRMNLAQALMRRSDLLLLDEPTNHLDLDAVLWLQQWLAAYPGTVLVVSHDRDFLDAVCSHTVHLENQTAIAYTGNYSAFEKMRAEKLSQQAAQHASQQRRVAELQRFVDRFKAKATKARQAQSRVKMIERMQQVDAVHAESPFRFQFIEPPKLPDPLVTLDGINAGYGDTVVLRDVQRRLEPGDRIGLLGRNGAGKTTLVRSLAGELAPLSGERKPHPDLRIGYFAQHQIEQLDPQASPLLHLQRLEKQRVAQGGGHAATDQAIRTFLGGFNFVGDRVFESVAPFSGGEKARLALAMVTWQKPNVLLLDEPTNHLDLDMRHALERALADFAGAVLIVSHDRHLLGAACDQLWLIRQGQCDDFDGDLEDYARWVKSADSAKPASKPASKPAADKPAGAPKTQRKTAALSRAQQKPLRDTIRESEKKMTRLERKIAELDQQLADPALYQADSFKAAELAKQQGDLRSALETAEAAWMAASEQLEAAS